MDRTPSCLVSPRLLSGSIAAELPFPRRALTPRRRGKGKALSRRFSSLFPPPADTHASFFRASLDNPGGSTPTSVRLLRWCPPAAMALKAVHVSGVPRLDQVPARLASAASCLPGTGSEGATASSAPAKFLVIGHRGRGMNALASPDRRMRAVKENSVLSFNEAGRFPVDFVEFDVQVTEDGCPVIFHDNYILAEENGIISEKRVTELRLEEFFSYGPQRDIKKIGKSLHRKTKDGGVFSWKVENDDPLCTLEEVFQKVDPKLGFNIELKFDDHVVYKEEELTRSLQLILKVVYEFANDRPIIFSSFQPDAAQLVRKLQNAYPVFFLTNGGNEVFSDDRRNSLDEAIKHCLAHGLQGIVSEVRGVFRNPSLVPTIKESNLGLLTYGQLNNVAEAVCMQHLMGIDGVIVDHVQEITEVVSDFCRPRCGCRRWPL